jgi:transcriptional regulator with XRE-family HTH domain
MAHTSVFWDDLAQDLKDPEFARAYIVESLRIATVDSLVNQLDQLRASLGLTKAELARKLQVNPSVIRRLFSAEHVNPTVATLVDIASVLGLQVTLEPLPAPHDEYLSRPLREGTAINSKKIFQLLHPIQPR